MLCTQAGVHVNAMFAELAAAASQYRSSQETFTELQAGIPVCLDPPLYPHISYFKEIICAPVETRHLISPLS